MRVSAAIVLLVLFSTGLLAVAQENTANRNDTSFREAGSSSSLIGSGQKNYVPLWLSRTKLGSSHIFQSVAGEFGVGTTTPVATFDVNGNVNAATGYDLGGTPFAFGSYANGNVFLGFAGNSTTTGTTNTASGYQALASNTSGQQNTASGYKALFSNNSGNQNTAVGEWALFANTTGSGNVAIGIATLESNTTGSGNIAIGGLPFNTSGSNNTVIGFGMYTNTTGSNNTAVGEFTIGSSSGNYNTATGHLALYSNPCDASYNTAVGYAAGYTSYSIVQCGLGNNDTYVGANTNVTDLRFNNATAVGANAQVSASNSMVLGSINGVNGATASTNVGIGTTTPSNVFTIGKGAGHAIADGWSTYSSRRWKTNIQTLRAALAKVEQLRGVSYDLKESGKHEVGVIAEEVATVVPEIVSWDKNGKDARGVDYSRLTALLIEATKEQQTLIRKQEEQIRTQQIQIRRLASQVRVIQASLKTKSGADAEVRTAAGQ
jgi:hypothetical protein